MNWWRGEWGVGCNELRLSFRGGRRSLDGSAAGQIGDHQIGAVFTAGEADGGDPRGVLVDQGSEDQQMQNGRDCGRLWAAAGWRNGFADGFDAWFSWLQGAALV